MSELFIIKTSSYCWYQPGRAVPEGAHALSAYRFTTDKREEATRYTREEAERIVQGNSSEPGSMWGWSIEPADS